MATISELIQGALDAGRTVRQLADDSGGRIKFQTFQTLSKAPPKQFPKEPKTITGMALALKVPESTIVLAYAKGLGIQVSTDSSFALRLPPGVDAIDPAMQDALIGVVRAALRSGARRLRRPVTEDEGEEFPAAFWDDPSESPGEDRRQHGQ